MIMMALLVSIFIIGVLFMITATLINDRNPYSNWDVFFGVVGGTMVVLCWIPSVMLYGAYIIPDIDASADKHCKSLGFDTFERWTGKGFFPEEYLFVKCKFVENRRDMRGQLDVNLSNN